MIIVYLRRSFLPPYIDKFCDIRFVLKIAYSQDNYNIPNYVKTAFYNTIDSIYSNTPFNWKDNETFLQAKIDSLLVSEEELLFMKFNLNIFGKEVFQYGYGFVTNILKFITEKGKSTDFLESLLGILENNWKSYADTNELRAEK